MKNQFYNRKCFCLVKVKFSESTPPYIYACHKSYKVNVGDIVVVPTNNEDFKSDKVNGYQHLKTVRVCGLTNDMTNISQDYALKHIVCKVDTELYDKIYHAKNRRNSKRS